MYLYTISTYILNKKKWAWQAPLQFVAAKNV